MKCSSEVIAVSARIGLLYSIFGLFVGGLIILGGCGEARFQAHKTSEAGFSRSVGVVELPLES